MATEKMPSKSSENRRSNKPIMEKRRRARINNCLNDLKTLILEAMKKDPARHSKLEKADILEMTVKYLQNLQRQQMALAVATDPTVLSKYRAGFNECAAEVNRYVSRMDGIDPTIRTRLLNHLSSCLAALAPVGYAGLSASSSHSGPGNPGTASSIPVVSPVHIQIPGPSGISAVNLVSPMTDLVSGIQLVPSRLSTGEIAFLLPSQTLASSVNATTSSQLPGQMIPIFSPTTSAPSSTTTTTTINGNHPPMSTCNSPAELRASPSPKHRSQTLSTECEGPLALTVSPSSVSKTATSLSVTVASHSGRDPLSPASTVSSNTSTLSPVGSDFSDSNAATPTPSPNVGGSYVSSRVNSPFADKQPSRLDHEHDFMWRPWSK